MKIANFSVQQKCLYRAQTVKSIEETLSIRKNGAAETFTTNRNAGEFPQVKQPVLLRMNNKKDLSSAPAKTVGNTRAKADRTPKQSLLRMLEDMVYCLTGKRIKLHLPEINLEDAKVIRPPDLNTTDFGLSYDYREITIETESVSYEASGYVATSDGRHISFAVLLNMNRMFYQENNFQLRIGNTVDPLVISLDGTAPKLSQNQYAFDLDNDGLPENISFVTGGSGFLALDKNGWIDESDDVFSKLSVLIMNEDGEKTLFRLGEVGIGAIYLKEMNTPFSIKDETGEYGKMRNSSVYLRENGTAGTIHHIDLVV